MMGRIRWLGRPTPGIPPGARRIAVALACLGLVGIFLALPGTGPARGEPGWTWPILPPVVLAGFSAPEQAWASGHRGIDLAAAPGSQVLAISAGTVAFAGSIAGKPVIAIDHPAAGLRSTYEPVVARVDVGTRVLPGTVIGEVAPAGGHCGGRCVHLGVIDLRASGGKPTKTYLDPMRLMRRWAVLKPARHRRPGGAPG